MSEKTVTMKVLRTFPREGTMIVRYANDTFMVSYKPGVKTGEAVEVRVELDD